MTTDPAGMPDVSKRSIALLAARRYFIGLLSLGAMFFIPAGTFDYWQAWLYLGIMFGLVAFLGTYLVIYEPAVVERRMRTRETEAAQQRIVRAAIVLRILNEEEVLMRDLEGYREYMAEVPYRLLPFL